MEKNTEFFYKNSIAFYILKKENLKYSNFKIGSVP